MPASRPPPLALLPEGVLVELSRSGDRAAYGELVRRHIGNVRGFLLRLGAGSALADDMTQDTFLAAMSDIGSYRGEAPLGAWLRTIAARTLFRRRRLDARSLLLGEAAASNEVNQSERGQEPNGTRLDLDAALARLSPAERACVTLSHAASFSHSEIAGALQMPVGTVKSHIARGLARLRSLLSSYQIKDEP